MTAHAVAGSLPGRGDEQSTVNWGGSPVSGFRGKVAAETTGQEADDRALDQASCGNLASSYPKQSAEPAPKKLLFPLHGAPRFRVAMNCPEPLDTRVPQAGLCFAPHSPGPWLYMGFPGASLCFSLVHAKGQQGLACEFGCIQLAIPLPLRFPDPEPAPSLHPGLLADGMSGL